VGVWNRPAARALLANFGGGDACGPSTGLIGAIQTRGPRWHTTGGARVGSTLAALRRAHPRARRAPGVAGLWLLAPRRVPCLGDCGGARTTLASEVQATVRAGRVTGFTIAIGAAGE